MAKTAAKTVAAPVAKTTKAAAEAPASAGDRMAAARAARNRAANKDIFRFRAKAPEGAKKLAPQAQSIVNLIEAAGKKGISREELTKEMEGVVTTRQPQSRILGYYQNDLEKAGFITIEKAKADATASKAEKAEDADEDGEEEEEE
jgi:hypothetical protein